MQSVNDLPKTVQELLQHDLMDSAGNEMVEVLEFVRQNGVPLTDHQVTGLLILRENGLSDLADFVTGIRPAVTPTKKFFQMVEKLTLADRIKGNAKLSTILKANANPANAAVPSGRDSR